ncbi:hypothetical protein ACWATR_38300 [Nostoc sp. UIC 10890]
MLNFSQHPLTQTILDISAIHFGNTGALPLIALSRLAGVPKEDLIEEWQTIKLGEPSEFMIWMMDELVLNLEDMEAQVNCLPLLDGFCAEIITASVYYFAKKGNAIAQNTLEQFKTYDPSLIISLSL